MERALLTPLPTPARRSWARAVSSGAVCQESRARRLKQLLSLLEREEVRRWVFSNKRPFIFSSAGQGPVHDACLF